MIKPAAALLLFVSCATADSVFEIPITTIDQPEQRAFVLRYVNNARSDVCIGSGNWPSSNGVLDNSGDRVYVIIDGSRHYLERQSDYCADCVTRVARGAMVTSRLTYSSFNIAASDDHKAKQLVFRAFAERCPRRRVR